MFGHEKGEGTPRRSIDLLNEGVLNRGTAFSEAEQGEHGLEGPLPPAVETRDRRVERLMGHCDEEPSGVERHVLGLGGIGADGMFPDAARAGPDEVGREDREQGTRFPPRSEILGIESPVATRVAEALFERGEATVERPEDVRAWIEALNSKPEYH